MSRASGRVKATLLLKGVWVHSTADGTLIRKVCSCRSHVLGLDGEVPCLEERSKSVYAGSVRSYQPLRDVWFPKDCFRCSNVLGDGCHHQYSTDPLPRAGFGSGNQRTTSSHAGLEF